MIQTQLKLKPTRAQELRLDEWLPVFAAIWNWGVRKIELNARDGIYFSRFQFKGLLAGHSQKIGVPSAAIRGTLSTVWFSWQRCFKKQCGKPRLKGTRNKLNSIPFPDCFLPPVNGRITLPGIGRVRFFKQPIPCGKIKCGRVIQRATGWYLCLWIDTERAAIPAIANGRVGIDPGFTNLLAFSTGEKIDHPREFAATAVRLGQAQRGGNRTLASRIQERMANRRKDRNHKLSRRLVSENQLIAFSADHHRAIARRFGKSVGDSAHYQIRRMLSYKSKCRTDGLGVYVEPDSRNSTRTCSACGALTGPQGWAGLSVREWDCGACGAHHDRDTNAGMNALISGAGLAHETLATAA